MSRIDDICVSSVGWWECRFHFAVFKTAWSLLMSVSTVELMKMIHFFWKSEVLYEWEM